MRNIPKELVCAYCESNASDTNSKCTTCEFNSAYGINFQLGKDARMAIAKGVMTPTGATEMVLEANEARFKTVLALLTEEGKGEGVDDGKRA